MKPQYFIYLCDSPPLAYSSFLQSVHNHMLWKEFFQVLHGSITSCLVVDAIDKIHHQSLLKVRDDFHRAVLQIVQS